MYCTYHWDTSNVNTTPLFLSLVKELQAHDPVTVLSVNTHTEG